MRAPVVGRSDGDHKTFNVLNLLCNILRSGNGISEAPAIISRNCAHQVGVSRHEDIMFQRSESTLGSKKIRSDNVSLARMIQMTSRTRTFFNTPLIRRHGDG